MLPALRRICSSTINYRLHWLVLPYPQRQCENIGLQALRPKCLERKTIPFSSKWRRDDSLHSLYVFKTVRPPAEEKNCANGWDWKENIDYCTNGSTERQLFEFMLGYYHCVVAKIYNPQEIRYNCCSFVHFCWRFLIQLFGFCSHLNPSLTQSSAL